MKIFFIVSAMLSLFSSETFTFDVLNTNNVVRCTMNIPANYTRSYSYDFTDVGGIGKTYVYTYRNGATLFISNGESLNLRRLIKLGKYKKECLPLPASIMKLVELEPTNTIKEEGRHCLGHYEWRELETKEICVGYYRVSKAQKAIFDNAIESLEIVNE